MAKFCNGKTNKFVDVHIELNHGELYIDDSEYSWKNPAKFLVFKNSNEAHLAQGLETVIMTKEDPLFNKFLITLKEDRKIDKTKVALFVVSCSLSFMAFFHFAGHLANNIPDKVFDLIIPDIEKVNLFDKPLCKVNSAQIQKKIGPHYKHSHMKCISVTKP